METYKNILANKFMRDTNYIIIKDTDDLEELERQWELFNSQLTVRQQRLSDDRSIEIWNMTNKEHYEDLKIKLMKDINPKPIDSDDENNDISYDTEDDEDIQDEEITNLINMDLDDFEIPDDENDITESIKEDSVIPIENKDIELEPKSYHSFLMSNQDIQKDNIADQYEIDTNMHIVGRVTGKDVDEYLSNLEKSFIDFNAQTHDHRRKSDDKCREIYGMSNIERYNKLKANALNLKLVKSTDNKTLDSSKVQQLGEFVSQVYNNMQAVNEVEQLKVNKHRRFNDTPYFTPTELIDMGVHGNHNFYSKDADNDGLITNIKVATWFDSYKDMCMDHIFEDYRKDWIDTLDMLYSDFEDIKASGDEEKILARKQSILDLGWNPEIPFNRKNRLKASERVSKILDETIPKDIFINLDDIPESEEDDIIEEQITKKTHQPVFLIFTQGKTPIISSGIKFVTHSKYSHASISFDPELNEVYSFNMGAPGENGSGFVRENLKYFKDNVISVMAFFAPNKVVDNLKEKINSFKDNKTTYDFGIILNKLLHIDRRTSNNEYNQVCSTFVDSVLKSNGINLTGDIEIPDPGQLYNASKSAPNKIIEIFNDVATKYNGKSIKKKLNTLYNRKYVSIEENFIKNKNDINFNIDSLAAGTEHNILFITGHSGAGKTTLINEYRHKYKKSICISGDFITRPCLEIHKNNRWSYPNGEKFKKVVTNELLEYYDERIDFIKNTIPNQEEEIDFDSPYITKIVIDFLEWLRDKLSTPKYKDYIGIFEGTQVLNLPIEYIQNEPIIIKGTSVLSSYIRKQKRDIKPGKSLKRYKASLIDMIPVYIKNERKINNIISSIDEVTISDSITLRNATKDDADNMFKWQMESIDSNHKNDPKVIKSMKDDVQKSIKITKMIMYNGETIGMLTTDILEPGSDYWYIGEIYIVKEHRNKGIGTALLKDEISKHDKLILQVDISNHSAIKLYKSLGFSIREKNDKDGMYVMTLDKKEKPIKESVQYVIEEQGSRREVAMTKNLIDFYKESTKDWEIGLKHLRWNNNVKGIMILSDSQGPIKDEDRKLLGYVAVEKQKEGNMIIGLEVSPHYFQVGIGSHLLYLAENELGATLLSVNKSNDKAIKMYKNNGWSEYKTSDKMIFMQKQKVVPFKEYTSILNEVKRFPIEFDKEGNLIIYKARVGSLAFGDEIDDSVQLLQAYRNAANIEGIKYELAKLWYINDCIEKKLKKRLSNNEYKELIDTRATCLNVFKSNLDYVMKAEKGFNFSDYYNSTPFSDNSTKITANTLKYMVKTVTNVI